MRAAEGMCLTVHAGERDRADGRPLAEALLDLFEHHAVDTSVLLRGAEGFGRLHHLRTDRLLSLSDDLPVLAVALDRRERIEALVSPVLQIARRGLVTVERAQLIGEDGDMPLDVPAPARLTVHLGRHARIGRRPATLAACDLLQAAGVAGATVLLGVDGTRHGRRSRAALLARNRDVPAMIVAVGDAAPVRRAIDELARRLPDATLAVEPARVLKRDGRRPERPDDGDGADGPAWQRLTVYSSQAALVDGAPIHLQILRGLRRGESAGATCVRGAWGFHGDHAPHGDRFWQLRRRAPVVTFSVDTPQRCAEAWRVADPLTPETGLVTLETVHAAQARSATETVGELGSP